MTLQKMPVESRSFEIPGKSLRGGGVGGVSQCMFGRNTAVFSSKEAGNRWTWTVLLCSETDDLFQIQF